MPDATRTSVGITSKSASAMSDAELPDELDSAHSGASASFTSSHQPAPLTEIEKKKKKKRED